MGAIATENKPYSNVFKAQFWKNRGWGHEAVTYNGAAREFLAGELLKVDGTLAAADTEIYGICAENVSAEASVNTQVLVCVKGPAYIYKDGLHLNGMAIGDVVAKLATMDIESLD